MKHAMVGSTVFVLALALGTAVFSEPKEATSVRVYFGTSARGENAGIWTSILDTTTGKLGKTTLAGKARGTRILAMAPGSAYLFASGMPGPGKRNPGGRVSAFRVDPATGKLTFVNSQPSNSVGICYLLVDPRRQALLAAHYRGGSCAVLPIAQDGSLKPVSSFTQHAGSSVHPKRQRSPHPHAIVLDPAGRFAFVPDLGLDQVVSYRFEATSGTLTPNKPPFCEVPSGGGPRHFAFHPAGRFAYVNLELTSKVIAFGYDAEQGALKLLQTASTLPKDAVGKNAPAGLCLTLDGRFLYVSNRGHNSIAIFAVDSKKGTLTPRGHESTRGDVPQTITIDPTGCCLLMTDRNAGRVRVFRIDKQSGRLTHAHSIEIPQVGMVAFRKRD